MAAQPKVSVHVELNHFIKRKFSTKFDAITDRKMRAVTFDLSEVWEHIIMLTKGCQEVWIHIYMKIGNSNSCIHCSSLQDTNNTIVLSHIRLFVSSSFIPLHFYESDDL